MNQKKSAFLKSAFQSVNFVWEALICAILGSESQKFSDEEKPSEIVLCPEEVMPYSKLVLAGFLQYDESVFVCDMFRQMLPSPFPIISKSPPCQFFSRPRFF